VTTIIADAKLGVMVSDSHWSDGDEVGPARKVWRYRGVLVGMAGSMSHIREVRAWFRKGCRGRATGGDVTAICLSTRGVEVWTPIDGFLPMPDQWAIGTGGKAARAALMAGASPVKAMAITKLIDSTTSGPTRTYKLRKT
jgi:ATP-dependent protease HslVU (ClpYQ) peptidase subunit